MPFEPGNKHGNRFKKGESGNALGKPRKLLSTVKGLGYTRVELQDSLTNLITLTIDQLKDHEQKSDVPALERIICRAILKSYKNGSLYNIEVLMDRIFGRPTESKHITGEIDFKSVSIEYVLTNVPDTTTQLPGES